MAEKMELVLKVTERIPGQLLASEDLPLGPILQTRMRSLARSFVSVHLQGVANCGTGIWVNREVEGL